MGLSKGSSSSSSISGRPPQVVVAQPVVAQPVIVAGMAMDLGSMPTFTTCPRCNQKVMTSVSYDKGIFFWVIFCIVFWCFCWIGIGLFALFMCCCCLDSFHDAAHYCPQCRTLIGISKKI